MISESIFVFFLLGFFVSILLGLTGMGGAAFTTPILILLGIPPAVAVGSDLAFTSFTGGLGSLLHGRNSSIDFGLVKLILFGSIPATLGSYFLLLFLRAELGVPALSSLLTELLAVILISISAIGVARAIFRSQAKNKIEENTNQTKPSLIVERDCKSAISLRTKAFIVVAGACVGFAVQMTSVGSGTILIFLLMFVFNSKKIVGTSMVHAFILTLIGAFLHFQLGDVDLSIVGALTVGGVLGVFLGVRLLSRVSFPKLREILNIIIMGAGFTLIVHLLA
ncbi:MAG TPA: sulfite exporter TauE/SafE family protein [Nitrososphaerales archaeon]|nr:sulfite exporter TauE/SafE family protein [Nitrososphaerales archaeon]